MKTAIFVILMSMTPATARAMEASPCEKHQVEKTSETPTDRWQAYVTARIDRARRTAFAVTQSRFMHTLDDTSKTWARPAHVELKSELWSLAKDAAPKMQVELPLKLQPPVLPMATRAPSPAPSAGV